MGGGRRRQRRPDADEYDDSGARAGAEDVALQESVGGDSAAGAPIPSLFPCSPLGGPAIPPLTPPSGLF